MKKLPLILVAAILALILTAGVVVAKVEVNKIELNIDGGTYKVGDTVLSASVVLSGNTREKDGDKYLSPLNGTITIGGEEHNISVKAEKQSEPLIHIQNGVYDVYMQPSILVNIEGWKSTGGDLVWGTKIIDEVPTEYSKLDFLRTVDGDDVNCQIPDPFLIID